jgi:hypothetical protein
MPLASYLPNQPSRVSLPYSTTRHRCILLGTLGCRFARPCLQVTRCREQVPSKHPVPLTVGTCLHHTKPETGLDQESQIWAWAGDRLAGTLQETIQGAQIGCPDSRYRRGWRYVRPPGPGQHLSTSAQTPIYRCPCPSTLECTRNIRAQRVIPGYWASRCSSGS